MLFRGLGNGKFANVRSSLGAFEVNGVNISIPGYARSMASRTSESTRKSSNEVLLLT